MTDSKVSVIIPVFRTEKYLEKCIASVLTQTYRNLEIILVDDGSDDNCPSICDSYAEKDERIIVIHKENGGLSSARNAGLVKATGDYIAFVDSDDYIDREMYERLVKSVGDGDISICGYFSVSEKKQKKHQSFSEEKEFSEGDALRALFEDSLIKNYVCDKLFKRELFKGISFPDERIFEDILTTYRLFEKSKKIIYVPFAGYYYVTRNGAISKSSDSRTCFARYMAHYDRYNDVTARMPQYKGILLRQIFIQARAYLFSAFDLKSNYKSFVIDFFAENEDYIASCDEFSFFEKKQAVGIAHGNLTAFRVLEPLRKVFRLINVLTGLLKGKKK